MNRTNGFKSIDNCFTYVHKTVKNTSYIVRMTIYIDNADTHAANKIIHFNGQSEGAVRVIIQHLDFFKKKRNGKISRDKQEYSVIFPFSPIIYDNKQLTLVTNNRSSLQVDSGKSLQEDYRECTIVKNTGSAYITFEVMQNSNTNIQLPYIITERGTPISDNLRPSLIIPINVTGIRVSPLINTDSLACEKNYLSKGVEDWCNCLRESDNKECRDRAAAKLRLKEMRLANFARNTAHKETDRLKAAVEYLENTKIVCGSFWGNAEEMQGIRNVIQLHLDKNNEKNETIRIEKEEWAKLLKQEAQYRKEGKSLGIIQDLYDSFLTNHARSTSQYRQMAEEALNSRLQPIKIEFIDSAGWTVYSFSNVKSLYIQRDPLNDNSWEVNYDELENDPPRIRVRQVGLSERYRLFLHDKEWGKYDTIDLSQPFRVELQQKEGHYIFSFVGSPGPYKLQLRAKGLRSTLWQTKDLKADQFQINKDSLLALIVTSNPDFDIKTDSLSLLFYATDKSISKFIPVRNGELWIPNPWPGSPWLWIVLGFTVLIAGSLFIFLFMKKRKKKQQSSFLTQHQFND